MTTLSKIAKAIADAWDSDGVRRDDGGVFERLSEEDKAHMVYTARAAVEAMMEPTDAVLKRGARVMRGDPLPGDTMYVFRAMLQAILDEKP